MSQKHILEFCLKGKLIIFRQLIFHIQKRIIREITSQTCTILRQNTTKQKNPWRISSGSCKAISYQLINKFLDMHSYKSIYIVESKKEISINCPDKYHLKHMTHFFFLFVRSPAAKCFIQCNSIPV